MLTTLICVLAIAGDSFADHFDDGAIASSWLVFELGDDGRSVEEANGRLEFPSEAPAGGDSDAGVIARTWLLGLESDFAVRVSWHHVLTTAPDADFGLSVAFVARIDGFPHDPDVRDAVELFVGSNEKPYLSADVTVDGRETASMSTERETSDGTLYVAYDADTDTISISPSGFDDPDAFVVPGIGGAFGADAFRIGLIAYSTGASPALDGDDVYLDDFVIEVGTIVPVSPADLDLDGVVGVTDLLIMLAGWGPCGDPPCLGDTDASGTVDVSDLLTLLADWSG